MDAGALIFWFLIIGGLFGMFFMHRGHGHGGMGGCGGGHSHDHRGEPARDPGRGGEKKAPLGPPGTASDAPASGPAHGRRHRPGG